jgi:hypothetical protein
MIAVADYSYFKHFSEISSWYDSGDFSGKVQATYLVESFVAHLVNGVTEKRNKLIASINFNEMVLQDGDAFHGELEKKR